jgi:ribosomal protein L37AE/L43A
VGKLKKIWADPVWSKVISIGVLALVGIIYSYFQGWLPFIFQWSFSKSQVPNWLIALSGLIVFWNILEIAYKAAYRSRLEFDESTGTWIDRKTNLRYCPVCKSQKISSPLHNGTSGWSCPVCTAYFRDHARKNYTRPPHADLGPNSWMAR